MTTSMLVSPAKWLDSHLKGERSVESSTAEWRKSSFSSAANCVEVALMSGRVAVRDSKDRNGPMLEFSRKEWTAFVAGVRAGEFNTPRPT